MSWSFDTENWAAGIYNSWAETRTDEWREAMARAVRTSQDPPLSQDIDFAVPTPPGVSDAAPFSFIVIGDTGEGDASQHVLRDQLLAVSSREDVRFVVVSSDVVYPNGAMRDYETSSGCRSRASRRRYSPSPATTIGTTRSKGSTRRS